MFKILIFIEKKRYDIFNAENTHNIIGINISKLEHVKKNLCF